MAYESIHTGVQIDAAVSQMADVENVRQEVAQNKADAVDAANAAALDKTAAQTAANEAELSKLDAAEAKGLAELKANEAAGSANDAELAKEAAETAEANAQQHELKAKEYRDSAAQVAAGNIIDDVTPSPGLVYSSQKVSTDLAAKVSSEDLADDTDPDKGAGIIGYSGRDLAARIAEYLSIKDKGAKGDGTTNDSAAELSAHAERDSVFYPEANGVYLGTQNPMNLYDVNSRNALFGRIQSGLNTSPTDDPSPVFWVNKFSSVNRSVNPSAWDQGAVYGQIIKVSGDAYGAAVTGNVRHNAGAGQMVGLHGRGYAMHEDAEIWGLWAYASVSSSASNGAKHTIGIEVDLNNDGGFDPGWMEGIGAMVGGSRGMVISTADDSLQPGTIGMVVQAQNRNVVTNDNVDRWYTGILIPKNSVVPVSDATGATMPNNEYMRLEGNPVGSGIAGGIRLRSGRFLYGFSTTESSFTANCAILLKRNHRITFGDYPGQGSYITFTDTAMFNVNAAQGLGIAGTRVLASRQTGWGAASGASDKTAFTTYNAPTVSATYDQAEIQALATAVQVASRHIGALINDLRNHGMIGD